LPFAAILRVCVERLACVYVEGGMKRGQWTTAAPSLEQGGVCDLRWREPAVSCDHDLVVPATWVTAGKYVVHWTLPAVAFAQVEKQHESIATQV